MSPKSRKGIRQKLCEFGYRQKRLCRKYDCMKKSMDEVCRILNPGTDKKG